MLQLFTPRGLAVDVPQTIDEQTSRSFSVDETNEAMNYFEANGYVIFKRVFSHGTCDKQRALWAEEVKPFKGYMYRQATAKAEKHDFNQNMWVMNPILNLQSVDPKLFPNFRAHSTEVVLASPILRRLFSVMIKDDPKIVQSMYFEGNSETWEHQDTYYLDSERVGSMVAAWIALENIEAAAGRFFVCPGSQKIEMPAHSSVNNIAENHEEYIQSVVGEIKSRNLKISAPFLEKGDVLFWNSRTIHGSLASQDANNSRSSITCHAIPASRKFLQLQTRLLAAPADKVNGTLIHRPKDLSRALNRAVIIVESNFPKSFYWLKRTAIKFLVGRKSKARVKRA